MARGKKTGGRVKGTPNKLTKEMRSVLKNIVANELDILSSTINHLEPLDRINLLLKLLPFVLPQVRDILHDKGEPKEFF